MELYAKSVVNVSLSFAHRELVAPLSFWEREAGASDFILPSALPFPLTNALSKQIATSPTGETRPLNQAGAKP